MGHGRKEPILDDQVDIYVLYLDLFSRTQCETVRADVQIGSGTNGGVNHSGMPRLR